MPHLERKDFVLAVLSTANGGAFTPVQVQKLFFLLDARASGELGGSYFHFEPYDYGPFDSDVYSCLDVLSNAGAVVIDRSGYVRTYRLTPEGQSRGERVFAQLPASVQDFTRRCSEFVRTKSFTELVSAIYREFPDMRANSVFREPA